MRVHTPYNGEKLGIYNFNWSGIDQRRFNKPASFPLNPMSKYRGRLNDTTSSFTILRRALPAEKIAFTLAEVLIAL
jgi:hypothetical protein